VGAAFAAALRRNEGSSFVYVGLFGSFVSDIRYSNSDLTLLLGCETGPIKSSSAHPG
jgi:hypothetical protein